MAEMAHTIRAVDQAEEEENKSVLGRRAIAGCVYLRLLVGAELDQDTCSAHRKEEQKKR